MQEQKTNIKQELFCKYYIEEKGNGTLAYMKAYSIKNKQTAKVGASRMLTNANIITRLYEIIKELGFNDIAVDIQLMNLIYQNSNLTIKLRAISEYNKLRMRYNEIQSNTNILNATGMFYLPSKEGISNKPVLTKPIEEMTFKELESARQILLK